MEQTVRVQEAFENGTARVAHIRQSACSGDCHQCSGCGAAKETVILTVNNPIGAKPGDRVVIASKTGPVLMAAAVLYILPVMLFITGYLAGEHLWQQGPLVGTLAFVASLVLAGLYDRLVMKRKDTVYTIIGFAPEA